MEEKNSLINESQFVDYYLLLNTYQTFFSRISFSNSNWELVKQKSKYLYKLTKESRRL